MCWNFRNNLGLSEVVQVIEILKLCTVSPKSILPEQMSAWTVLPSKYTLIPWYSGSCELRKHPVFGMRLL